MSHVRAGELRWGDDVEFAGKQATAVLQIVTVSHLNVARGVRAALLDERAESMVADLFNGADNEPAVSKNIRSVAHAVWKKVASFGTESQPIQRHKSAALVHVSVARSSEIHV